MSRDPASEVVGESNRREIVNQGPIRPVVNFPATGPRNLRFQRSWYDRDDTRQWLEYSVTADAAFCFVCRCFGSLGMYI